MSRRPRRRGLTSVQCFVGAGIATVLLVQSAWAETRILGIRHWSAPSSTRVVVDLSQEAKFRSFPLYHPPRVVVDLSGVRMGEAEPVVEIQDPLVARLRLGRHSPEVLRLVLDLTGLGMRHHVFLLPRVEDRPIRLVIDVESPALGKQIKEARQAVQKEKERTARVVVIDPGHGGEDPGAIGPRGTREKDVVLAIARKLHEKLSGQRGVRPFLTRKGDYFLTLRQRVEIAQDYGADLFISLHADASRNRRTRGASVYCLSVRGATDEAAQILAEKENASDLIGGVPLNGDRNLNIILLDMVQTQTINDSLTVGGILLTELEGINGIKFHTPRQAGFRVLKAPDIPSVLVETGFITNPREERLLRDPSFQARLADAVERATYRFLCQQQPVRPGRVPLSVCGEKAPSTHVVRRGQNLSHIALLYGTTVREIQRLNHLKDVSIIQPGQKILIP